MPRIRECVKKMQGYVPGAPARDEISVKLNQNENRYPPSPKALAAAAEAARNLSFYPESTSLELRKAAAQACGTVPERVMAANGSDEMLRIFFQAFCDPGDEVVAFYPSYTYYATLAAMQDVRYRQIDFTPDFRLPGEIDVSAAKLLFLPNPNAPTGVLFPESEIRRLLAAAPGCMVVIDEAYIAFSAPGSDSIHLIDEYPNLAVTRTLSKSHSLAGLRVGLGFAREEILAELEKVRDYYNLDRLSQAAAAAALLDREWLAETSAKIVSTRERTARALAGLGLKAYPSQANFLLVDCGSPGEAEHLYLGLGEGNVLVRYFSGRRLDSCLRIAIGTDQDMDRFLDALRELR